MLAAEGLACPENGIRVRHLMQVLDQDVAGSGLGRGHHPARWKGCSLAVHYGCHALRPARQDHRFRRPRQSQDFRAR